MKLLASDDYRIIYFLSTVLLCFASFSLTSCGQRCDTNEGLGFNQSTTSSQITVNNLNSQIQAYERRLLVHPKELASYKILLGLLLSRIQFFGQFDDFDRAFSLVKQAQRYKLDPAQTELLHAQVLSSVHRFDEALQAIKRAKSLGAKDTEDLRTTILLAQGQQMTPIEQHRRDAANKLKSYTSLNRLAVALSANGKFEESDIIYKQALKAYKDVSPLPVAWVAFQLGVMWGEAGDKPCQALSYYRHAVEHLSDYVTANVHLAEMEAEQGNLKQAIKRLKRIASNTKDPEPASRLAQLLEKTDPKQAATYAVAARMAYEYYLSMYPLAFADHAAEFYLGAGNNPKRALMLATLNVKNRKTARAYQLVIKAAFAADQTQLACEYIHKANNVAETSMTLQSLLRDSTGRCNTDYISSTLS